MVEIGTSGWPWRASGIAVGSAIGAETDGAHAVWFSDTLPIPVPEGVWAAAVGPLGAVIPDPTDLADPIVMAAAALLVTRRISVGILGWDPGPDPQRAARTSATLGELAPGRVAVAFSGSDASLRRVASELGEATPVTCAAYGDTAAAAADLGWDWIAVATDPETVAKRAGDAGVTGRVGVHLPVVVHPEIAVARRATGSPFLAPLVASLPTGGVVVGDPATLDAAVDAFVAHGVERIILEPLLPFGAPTELEAARSALRAVIRGARLRHRSP